MGWVSEDGLHEAYDVPIFGDGLRGNGSQGDDSQIRVGDEVWDEHVAAAEAAVKATGTDEHGLRFHREPDFTGRPNGYWFRPAAEVTGWQVVCDCRSEYDSSYTTWEGPRFTRVPSRALESLDINQPDRLALYAADEDVKWRTEEVGVEDLVRQLWLRHHLDAIEGATAVRAAAAALRAAEHRLDEAVGQARRAGASWETIGREVGLTRQAAHTRWRDRLSAGPGR